MTYLLRPNVTRPDRRAPATLETPPVTDIDYSSSPETDDSIDSDFVSEHELDSDVEMYHRSRNLSVIAESPSPSAPASLPPVEEDGWSHVEDSSDIDEFESSSEFGSAGIDLLEPRLASLSLQSPPVTTVVGSESGTVAEHTTNLDPDKTITEIQPQSIRDDASPRRRERTAMIRASSSPSRSPARMWPSSRRRNPKNRVLRAQALGARSFYEYLYA